MKISKNTVSKERIPKYILACLPWISFGVKHGSLVRLNGVECIAGLSLFTALDTDWCNYAILELFSPNELTGARIVFLFSIFSLRYPSVEKKELSTICHVVPVYKHETELNVNLKEKLICSLKDTKRIQGSILSLEQERFANYIIYFLNRLISNSIQFISDFQIMFLQHFQMHVPSTFWSCIWTFLLQRIHPISCILNIIINLEQMLKNPPTVMTLSVALSYSELKQNRVAC